MLARNKKLLQEYVDKYFPGAKKVRFEFASEYDDEYYNNTVSYIAALDENDNEILPTSGMAYEARLRARSFAMPHEELYQTDEYLENMVVGL